MESHLLFVAIATALCITISAQHCTKETEVRDGVAIVNGDCEDVCATCKILTALRDNHSCF